MVADAARFGIALADLPEQTGVWAEHVPAVEAWLSVCGQMRVVNAGSGLIWLGLDYAAARAGLDLAGIEMSPDLWMQIRVIETAAVKALNGEF